MIDDIVSLMNESDCVYGYFTAKVDDNPVVAFIERREAADDDWKEEGITTYYIVKHEGLYDTFLWDESERKEFIAKSAWAWDFHKKGV